jgi:alcohol dehydrogenase
VTGGPASGTARAAVLVAADRFEVRSFPVPQVTDDTALVEIELCGVCGTDSKYAAGKLPTPLPMILGHEVVGRIAAAGPAAAARYGVAAGDRVIVESSIPCWSCPSCRRGAYTLCPTKGGYGTRLGVDVAPGLWGGMAEQMYIAPGSILHRLPPSMPAEVAVGVPILANAIQWLVRRGGLGPGERVLVQGCGPQGLAAALVATASSASEVVVTGLARDAARLAFAEAAGARAVVVDPGWSRDARLSTVGREFDVVLDVSGSPAAISSAPEHARAQGTFVLAGLVGRGASVPFATDDLVYREIRVQGVLSKDEAAIRAALALVEADERVGGLLGRLVTHVFPLERASEAIAALDGGLPGFVKAAVRPVS